MGRELGSFFFFFVFPHFFADLLHWVPSTNFKGAPVSTLPPCLPLPISWCYVGQGLRVSFFQTFVGTKWKPLGSFTSSLSLEGTKFAGQLKSPDAAVCVSFYN